jgi:hypothetical protein
VRYVLQNRPKTGFALVTVLLFSGIILMMVLALFLSVRERLFTSQTYRNQTAALYLAESGLWDAVAQLEVDPTWTAGFQDKSLPGVPGSYTITFNTSGAPFSPDESVNNNDGTADANYRGANFVPSGCASLVVIANVGGYERKLEALVRMGGGLYPATAPIMTSGRVDLRGSVNIDGRKSQSDPTRVDADVQSNKAEADPNIVVWDGNGAASIDGKVSVVAPNADAINLSGYNPVGGTENGAAKQPIPDVNILAKVQANRNAPAAMINSSGTTTLSPPSATADDLYQGGDLNIQGDLVLDGVNLYVVGELHVNGSITGSGSVFVTKGTTLQGDARIASATPETIALFSEGNVRLSGFNGTEYMDSLAANDPGIAADWSQLSDSIHDYQTYLDTPGSTIPAASNAKLNALAQEISGGTSPIIEPPTVAGRKNNVTQLLMDSLASQPDSTAKMRMTQKFQDLNMLFFSYMDGTSEESAALQALKGARIIRGGFDAAVDKFATLSAAEQDSVKSLMRGYIDTIDYNHLGAAFFQGVIFTHGSVYTDAEVTVQGAIAAFDDGSQEPTNINGEDVNPGDLILQPLTRVSYIEEFFKPKDATGGAGAAGVQLLLWMGR